MVRACWLALGALALVATSALALVIREVRSCAPYWITTEFYGGERVFWIRKNIGLCIYSLDTPAYNRSLEEAEAKIVKRMQNDDGRGEVWVKDIR